MNKPIITLTVPGNNSPVLKKNIPQGIINQDFKHLVGYMADPSGDELNTPYREADEIALARRIQRFKRDMESKNDRAAYNLRFINQSGNLSDPISLDSRVRDDLGRILKTESVETERGPVEYQRGELILEYLPVGG